MRRAMSVTVAAAPAVDSAPRMTAAKAQIRRAIMEAVDGPARVFDAYAGAGDMHRAVWRHATAYTGCDLRFFRDSRTCFVGDNRRILRAIDLGAFNLFDLDAYGSPWEQALIIAANRRVKAGEKIGIALTEGSMLNLKLGGASNALRIIAGIHGDPAGMARHSDDILDAAIAGLARRLECEITLQLRAIGKTGARMRYIGLVMRGREVAIQPAVE